MKIKYALVMLASATVMNMFVSCGGDDAPPQPVVSFQTPAATVGEGAGTINVNVLLDKDAPRDITIRYSLTGTAIEGTTASADYKVVGKYGEIVIAEGTASGAIQLEIKQDALVENNETIIIHIDEVVSNRAKIGTNNETAITIESDDAGAEVNFTLTTLSVFENDGLLELEINLDKTMPQNITIQYELSGSAIDSITAWNQETLADYYIDGVSGEVVVEAGNTTANIRLFLYTDLAIEDGNPATIALDPETIVLTLVSGTNGTVIGSADEMVISLKQQDGRAVLLDWDENYTTVDMDLFLWIGPDVDNLLLLDFSINARVEPPELVFIPDNIAELFFETDNAAFGFSYTYWGGDVEPMNFSATFIDIANTVVEGAAERETFDASYMLVNINEWDNETTGTFPPLVVQTMTKATGVYTINPIEVPSSGSRVRSTIKTPEGLPLLLKRGGTNLTRKRNLQTKQ